MKKLLKYFTSMFAIILFVATTFIVSGCAITTDNNKDKGSEKLLNYLNTVIEDFGDSVFVPVEKISDSIDEYRGGEGFDIDEFKFIDTDFLFALQGFEQNGEYVKSDEYSVSILINVGKNKYKLMEIYADEYELDMYSSNYEVDILKDNKLQVVFTESYIEEEGTEYEYVEDYTATCIFTFDKENQFFKIEINEVMKENGEVCYTLQETVECMVKNFNIYAQSYQYRVDYEDGETSEDKRLYEFKSGFELESNAETGKFDTTITNFTGCYTFEADTFTSITERDLSEFASTNVKISW